MSPLQKPAEPEHHLVFVYGTLMRGCQNHRYLDGQTWLGDTRTVPGFRLHLIADYPGMVPQAEDSRGVPGELWSVSHACLRSLHRLEGVAEGLYSFDSIELQAPHDHLQVWTYLYRRSTTDRPVIEGRWNDAKRWN